MTLLILGENGSGKSALAEKAAWELSKEGRLFYIACMIPYGEEGANRVKRHRLSREKYGFELMERPINVSGLMLGKGDTALLEDASNLLANAMFEFSSTPSEALSDIFALAGKCGNLVVVSISGKSLEGVSDPETNRYIEALKELNLELSRRFDKTIQMGRD
jgi:adenosylcobinamide kinase/adenosylcobinamide-phosphate guanylyltransferase